MIQKLTTTTPWRCSGVGNDGLRPGDSFKLNPARPHQYVGAMLWANSPVTSLLWPEQRGCFVQKRIESSRNSYSGTDSSTTAPRLVSNKAGKALVECLSIQLDVVNKETFKYFVAPLNIPDVFLVILGARLLSRPRIQRYPQGRRIERTNICQRTINNTEDKLATPDTDSIAKEKVRMPRERAMESYLWFGAAARSFASQCSSTGRRGR